MVPKKAKEFIAATAEATGQSEELVKAVMDFYWSELKKSLIELKAPNIMVQGLGTFKLKTWKIDEFEKEQTGYLNHHKSKKGHISFQNFAIIKEVESKLERVQKVKKLIDADKLKREQVKEKRYGTKGNMAEQKKDPGGNGELPIQEGAC